MAAAASGRLGVGFIGAGMATQAIHLPTLATIADQFRVVHIMDTDPELATGVASFMDARASTSVDALLADPSVDVVAVCSPDRFHAGHVIAACRAGKRAVLCEKPLAVSRDEGQQIRAASTRYGVPVVVGTMHAHDPAFVAGMRDWLATADEPELIRSVIYLPSVGDQVAWSTEHRASGYVSFSPATASLPVDEQAGLIRTTVLDLAIHNTPLIRALIPAVPHVRFARVRLPFGYVMSLTAGDRLIQLIALMWGHWRPDWTFDVWGREHALHVEFPPSYVLAGSATAELRSVGSRTGWRFPDNGYQALWRYLSAVVADGMDPSAIDAAVSDLDYALAIADGAQRSVLAAA